jgi:ubiquinone/menaquinone biosynthesis C-methylase UbiE
MVPPRPTSLAQTILGGIIRKGDCVIDATAGNGHDTLFLAECVGPDGCVLAFDVQEAAITSAKTRIEEAGYGGRVRFFHESHQRIHTRASEDSVSAVMFNLGYLPGMDHGVTTQSEETVAALESSLKVIKPGGVLSVICYPGHPQGAIEAGGVEAWMLGLAQDGWRIAKYGALGTRRPAPFLLLASIPVGKS